MNAGGHVTGLGKTQRTDSWWIAPLSVAGGLTLWLIYYMWAALHPETESGVNLYTWGPYLSPFYSPLLIAPEGASALVQSHAWVTDSWEQWFSWWPEFLPKSPALLIFIFPATFRASCYYYRKAYYRSMFMTPPGCSVGPFPQKKYRGETGLLVLQNVHRYTLYFALALLPFLYFDTFWAFFNINMETGESVFGVGLGSLMIMTNAILLTGYTLGCHAWRHLIGGKLDCFTCGNTARLRFALWKPSTWFNGRHQQFAWASLIWIALTDMYVRLCATGVINDPNTWGL